MLAKTTLILGAAAGYVLGTRAGRKRYDQILEQINTLRHNPAVQEKVSQAQGAVEKMASATEASGRRESPPSGEGYAPTTTLPAYPPLVPQPDSPSNA